MRLRIPPSLYYRQYRLLWFGLMISLAGSQMQVWAIFWHIRELTDQPIALGGVGLARIFPVIVFSLVGGAIADVMDRRKVMMITQSILAVLALLLSLLTFSGQTTLPIIYLFTALQASVAAFDLPARQALVPNLLPAKDLPNAFSLNSIAFQTGAIVGPALSGLIIAYKGLEYVYLVNAISFLAVLAALVLMGPVKQQIPSGKQVKVSLAAVREGVDFILKQPIILSTMILDFFATFFASANTLMPIIAKDILKVGVVEYGWLSAAQSIGAVMAALVMSQISEIRRQGPLFLWSVVAFGLATVLFGLSQTMWMAMISLILVGAADSVSMVIRNTIRQLQTPDYIRGRMTSINQIFFMGGPQLGEMEAGIVAQIFGAAVAVVSGGIGCLLAVGWTVRRWPQLKTYNGDEPVMAGVKAAAD